MGKRLKRSFRIVPILLSALIICSSTCFSPMTAEAASSVSLTVGVSQIVMAVGTNQRWVFDKDGSDNWGFTSVQINDNGSWIDVFNNGGKFILGNGYNNKASNYTVIENTSSHVSVCFSGSGSDAGKSYTWQCTLEAWQNKDWVKRLFVMNYSSGGTAVPSFSLLSAGKIREGNIASFDSNTYSEVEFAGSLPLILARVDVSPIADVAIMMDYSNLADIGKRAIVKNVDSGCEVGYKANPSGVTVVANTNYNAVSYIYINNGKASSFGNLAKIATNSYWAYFPYPFGSIQYPLTANIPSWDFEADKVANFMGSTANATLDNSYLPVTIQAETASFSGGALVDTNHSGYTGTGFVAGYDRIGASAKITANLHYSGKYDINLRYSSGLGGNRKLSLYLNDSKIRQINLPSTTDWGTWATAVETVDISKVGDNVIEYRFDDGDNGFVNLDSITIYDNNPSPNFEAESSVLSGGTSIDSTYSGYSGSGYVVGFNSVGASTTFNASVNNTGNYGFSIWYSNGSGSSKTLSIYVNGTRIRQITLEATANWTTWTSKVETLQLKSKNIVNTKDFVNTVTLKYGNDDSGGINLDKIQISNYCRQFDSQSTAFFTDNRKMWMPFPQNDWGGWMESAHAFSLLGFGLGYARTKYGTSDSKYMNFKDMGDRLRTDGWVITDGSSNDGWVNSWMDATGMGDNTLGSNNANSIVGTFNIFRDYFNQYYMYKATGDTTYRDTFARMAAMMSNHLSQDTVNYTQPIGYYSWTTSMPYAPNGTEGEDLGLDAGGSEANYACAMLLAAKEFDNSIYKNLALKTIEHMLKLPYQQIMFSRAAVKPEAFGYAVRALVEAYQSFGLDGTMLDRAEEYAAEMLLHYYFNNVTWDGGGLYNTHSSIGMAHACGVERWEAFMEEAESIKLVAPLLKYRTPDGLMKMLAMARQNQLWAFDRNDSYLGYGHAADEDKTLDVPYEFMWENRPGAPREEYGIGEVFALAMFYETFASSSDDKVVPFCPTALEEYQTTDHIFQLYNTSDTNRNVTFKLKNMTDGNYRVYINDVFFNSFSFTTLRDTGIDVTVNAGTSVKIRAVNSNDTVAPSAPGAASASSIGQDTATITWSRNGSNVVSYNIYRGLTSGFLPDAANRVGQTKSTTFIDKSLMPSTTYYYKIKQVSQGGNESSKASSTSAATASASAPGQVTGLSTVSVTDQSKSYRQIKLQWNACTTSDFYKYKVYRDTVSNFTPSNSNFIGYSAVNSYADNINCLSGSTNAIPLIDGTTYYYKVSAINRLGNEGLSSSQVFAATKITGTISLYDECTSTSGWTSSSDRVALNNDGSDLVVTENGPEDYGTARKSFTVDMDRSPYIKIKLDSVGSMWSMSVTDGMAYTLQPDIASGAGVYVYNIKAATGWTGTKTFTLQVSPVGNNSTIKIDWIRFMSFEDDCDSNKLWTPVTATVSASNGKLTVTENDTGLPYGYVTATINTDLSKNRYISLKIDSASFQYSLAVSDGSDVYALQPDTSQTGILTYDITAATGWTGVKQFTFRICAVGEGSSVIVDWVKVGGFLDHFYNTTSSWTTNSTLVNENAKSRLTIKHNDPYYIYGNANRTVSIDVDQYPVMEICIPYHEETTMYALAVTDGSTNYVLRTDTNGYMGIQAFDLKAATGWTGTKNVTMYLTIICQSGRYKSISFDWVRFVHVVQ